MMLNIQPVRVGVVTLALVACGFVINGAAAQQQQITSLKLCRKNVPAAPIRGEFKCETPEFVSKEYIVGEPYTAVHSVTPKQSDLYEVEYRYPGEFPIPCHWRPLTLTLELGEELSTTHNVNVSGTAKAGGSVGTEVEAGVKIALAARARTEAWAQVELTTGYSWQSSVKIINKMIIPVHVCSRFTRVVTWDTVFNESRQAYGFRLLWKSECKFSNPELDGEVAILTQTTDCWTGEYVAKGNGHKRTRDVVSGMPIQMPCPLECPI